MMDIAIISGLMGMFGWGICDFLAKKTVVEIGAVKTLILTNLIGAGLMTIYLIKYPSLPDLSISNLVGVGIFGLLWAAAYLSFFRGLKVGKASVVGPVTSSYVILSAIISFVFLKEAYTLGKILTLSIIILGILSTSLDIKSLRNMKGDKKTSQGIPEALFCMLLFGISFPFWGIFMNQSGWIILIILVKLIISLAIKTYAMMLPKAGISTKNRSSIPWAWIFGIALFEAIGFGGVSWGFSVTSDTTSTIVAISSAYSVITVLLAFFLLKERLRSNQYIGIGLIITGVILIPIV